MSCRSGRCCGAVLRALAALALPAGAGAHAERATFFPDPNLGDFPSSAPPARAASSAAPTRKQRIKTIPRPDARRDSQQLLQRLPAYNTIQARRQRRQNGTGSW